MNRASMLQSLNDNTHWDIIIIGGGATGLGAAVDASTRGYKTLLLEQEDFAKGTSSRSTKLVHGGVRYLAQGNFKLVMDALKERGLLLKNAPHVTANFSFIIPTYKWWEKFYYGAGLKMYDLMAGRLGLGNTRFISKAKTAQQIPTIQLHQLKGGIVYQDGQFDDSRLAINLAQTAAENGATILNYARVTGLIIENKKTTGVILTDTFSRKEFHLRGTVVINATGVFTDAVLQMDQPHQPPLVTPSQGVHIVLDKKFYPGKDALMIPHTTDGRVLFAVPWHDRVLVGTTDTPLEKISLEPLALEAEINFILNNINTYLNTAITRADVLSVFAGLRPLVKIKGANKTSLMPRDHHILISKSGLITITGGKWTTYRKMAKEVINKAMLTGKLQKKECVTDELKIHGWKNDINKTDALHFYGADLAEIKKLYIENESWLAPLHPHFPYTKACVIWAVRNEMALTVEDVLARRTRMLFLDARAAIESAPEVARLMAEEMNKDQDWINEQTHSFITLAKNYLL
jgi:glycerol-3-phosphate dehydrogenase